MNEEFIILRKKTEENLNKISMAKFACGFVKTVCPHCGTTNWITNDENLAEIDISKNNCLPAICKCFQCKNLFWIDDLAKSYVKTDLLIANEVQFNEEVCKEYQEDVTVEGRKSPE